MKIVNQIVNPFKIPLQATMFYPVLFFPPQIPILLSILIAANIWYRILIQLPSPPPILNRHGFHRIPRSLHPPLVCAQSHVSHNQAHPR